MIAECALCRKKKELQLSHIVPKFVGRYLKKTSVGDIRNQQNPNRIVQDIEKHNLLCHDCEELFSASERYFANTIFYPYHNEKSRSFQYNNQLFYFITSLSWRSLHLDIVDYTRSRTLDYPVLHKMIDSAEIMRDYLLGKRADIGTIEHHIFFFDIVSSVKGSAFSQNPNSLVHRAINSYSAYHDNTIFTISNLMGIIIVTLYSKDSDEDWQGTQIAKESGTLNACSQGMRSKVGLEFLFWEEEEKRSSTQITETTKNKITSKINEKGNAIKSYPIYKDLTDDANIDWKS